MSQTAIQGASRPSLQDVVRDALGAPVSLSIAGAVITVSFVMRKRFDPTSTVLRRTGYISDALNGVVAYDLTADDTATAGIFEYSFDVGINPASGADYSYAAPGDGFGVLEVLAKLS